MVCCGELRGMVVCGVWWWESPSRPSDLGDLFQSRISLNLPSLQQQLLLLQGRGMGRFQQLWGFNSLPATQRRESTWQQAGPGSIQAARFLGSGI